MKNLKLFTLLLILLLNVLNLRSNYNFFNLNNSLNGSMLLDDSSMQFENFSLYLAYFKDIELPVYINLKRIKKIMDTNENSLGNKLPLNFINKTFKEIFFCEFDSVYYPLLFPYGKFSKDNIIVTITYNRGGAGGFNEEYYLSIFSKEGIFLKTMNIATYNGDDSGIWQMEATIDKNLILIINHKLFKSIETIDSSYDKLTEKYTKKYKIDKCTGEINEITKHKKK